MEIDYYIQCRSIPTWEGTRVIVSREDYTNIMLMASRTNENDINDLIRVGTQDKNYPCINRKYLREEMVEYKDECDRIDHINGNPLNNHRDNLRWATSSQNMINSKRTFEGMTRVWQYRGAGKWICKYGEFDTKEEAIDAMIRKAEEKYGEYVFDYFKRRDPTSFPPDNEQ